jgi:small-conductance mechanosensitive channel
MYAGVIMFTNFTARAAAITKIPAFPKMLTMLLIVLAVILATRLLSRFLLYWKQKLISRLDAKDLMSFSSVETKMLIIHKIVIFGIYFFACVFFLFQFESVRHIGVGLLASAGVAGIVVGMAAQSTLSNIVAGISISFSQPVRLRDAVIFEKEFGWIEDITLMHTIIRTWDNRRIVVPNSMLANTVIENWTITDQSLLGVVMVYADYACNVDEVRRWVKETVDTSPHSTSEKVAVVQVVDFTEKTVVLRVLCKSPDATSAWNLRCEIREKLLKQFAGSGISFPKIRIVNEK